MKTHRCKRSLEAQTPIRYGYVYNNACDKQWVNKWALYFLEWDSEYDYPYFLRRIGEVAYCPYCGKELEVE